jgi:hypothetical protein
MPQAATVGLHCPVLLTRAPPAALLHSPDTRLIVVDIGLGFHVELALQEAVTFIDDKERHLQQSAAKHTARHQPALCRCAAASRSLCRRCL